MCYMYNTDPLVVQSVRRSVVSHSAISRPVVLVVQSVSHSVVSRSVVSRSVVSRSVVSRSVVVSIVLFN